MKGISIKRFECYLLYLLSIHMAALFIFRFTLFCSIDYQFPAEIKGDVLLQSGAFLRGLWFDNVIACYILLLPLVVLWIAALCNYTAKWLFRFTTVYFSCFYSVSFVIAAANIPYFEYFFKTINSSIYNWFGYGGTTAGLMPEWYMPHRKVPALPLKILLPYPHFLHQSLLPSSESVCLFRESAHTYPPH